MSQNTGGPENAMVGAQPATPSRERVLFDECHKFGFALAGSWMIARLMRAKEIIIAKCPEPPEPTFADIAKAVHDWRVNPALAKWVLALKAAVTGENPWPDFSTGVHPELFEIYYTTGIAPGFIGTVLEIDRRAKDL